MDRFAYECGHQANADGILRKDNKYSEGTVAYQSWLDGWDYFERNVRRPWEEENFDRCCAFES